jgi:hypothetical protein
MNWKDDWEGVFWPATCAVSVILVMALHFSVPRVAAKTYREPTEPQQAIESREQTASNLTETKQTGDPFLLRSVFECRQGGVTVFSDQPCGRNAGIREIRTPNSMVATPVYPDQGDSEASVTPSPPVQSDVSQSPYPTQDGRCRQIELGIERIDARMREGYSIPEGEVLKDRRSKLHSEYYELRCKHFH